MPLEEMNAEQLFKYYYKVFIGAKNSIEEASISKELEEENFEAYSDSLFESLIYSDDLDSLLKKCEKISGLFVQKLHSEKIQKFKDPVGDEKRLNRMISGILEVEKELDSEYLEYKDRLEKSLEIMVSGLETFHLLTQN